MKRCQLSSILNYQTVPTLTQVFTCSFCYCSYTWTVQLIRGLFHLDSSFSCWFFKFFSQPSENVHLPVIFISSYKWHSFSNYNTHSHGFSFGTHCCKPLIQHLAQLCKFRVFQYVTFIGPLHSHDSTIIIGHSISLYHR